MSISDETSVSLQVLEVTFARFLLASLQLDALAVKHNRREILSALDALPAGLNDTYREAMDRICSQPKDDVLLAKRILSWISSALRPLTVGELQYALAIEPGSKKLDEDILPDKDLLVSVCAGLVAIDPKSNIIRLVHYTAQEYLASFRTVLLPVTEVDIAISCLTHLTFTNFKERVCDSTLGFRNGCECTICLEQERFTYAAQYWMNHASGALGKNSLITSLILELRNNKRAFKNFVRYWFSRTLVPLCHAGFKGLSVPSFAAIEARDEYGGTALGTAAEGGHVRAAVELLRREVDVKASQADMILRLLKIRASLEEKKN